MCIMTTNPLSKTKKKADRRRTEEQCGGMGDPAAFQLFAAKIPCFVCRIHLYHRCCSSFAKDDSLVHFAFSRKKSFGEGMAERKSLQ
jgi:hypothetical protein